MCLVEDRAKRLRNHYNLLASTLQIRGDARMSRVPLHLRTIKIKELREMQKRGVAPQKQLADVLGTRLLASVSRPMLKRYTPSDPDSKSHLNRSLTVENHQTMRYLIQMSIRVFPSHRHANGSKTCVF